MSCPKTTVWIDGRRVEGIMAARAELKALGRGRAQSFRRALVSAELFDGHTVSLIPPRPAPKMSPKQEPRRPGMLLYGHCLHRLGTYSGGRC